MSCSILKGDVRQWHRFHKEARKGLTWVAGTQSDSADYNINTREAVAMTDSGGRNARCNQKSLPSGCMKQGIFWYQFYGCVFFVFRNAANTLLRWNPEVVGVVSKSYDFLLFKLFKNYYLCMRVFNLMYISVVCDCAPCVPGVLRGQKTLF